MSLRLRSFVIILIIFLASETIFSIVSPYKLVKAVEVNTWVEIISPRSPSGGGGGGVAPTPTSDPIPDPIPDPNPSREKLLGEELIWEIIIKKIEAKIAEISAQIAILQAKMAQLKGEVVYERIPVDFTFTKFLKRDSIGNEIKCLQIILREEVGKDIVGAADGIFGPKTDVAVKKFQEKQGLVVDGIVGKNTRAELNKLLGK